MTSALETIDQQPEQATQQRRAPHMPSQRDFEIFRMAEIQNVAHQEIALRYDLSRRRVSQIVAYVRHWLSNNPCEDTQLVSALQRQRLDQHIERQRLEDIIRRAHGALTVGSPRLTTNTIQPDGTRTITHREQPFNVQVLKTYLRATEALAKLSQRPEIALPPPAEGEFSWAKDAMNEVLARWYERIWSRTLKIEHFYDFGEELIGVFVKALRDQQFQAAGPPLEAADPDDPLAAESEPLDEGESNDANDSESPHGDAEPDSSLVLCLSSLPPAASNTSCASQREAPSSPVCVTSGDDATDSASGTSVDSYPPEMSPPIAPLSPENPKREAPLPPTAAAGYWPPATGHGVATTDP